MSSVKKVEPSNLHVQLVSGQPEKKKPDGDGDLLSSRSGSSQGARRRAKYAERSQDLLTYQEAYKIVNGAASEFNRTRGYSSEEDARGTRSSISGLSTLLQQARDRLQLRDDLVEDVMARLRTTRNPLRQDPSAESQGHGGHTKATSVLFRRPMTPNRAGGRCGIPTPEQSPVNRRLLGRRYAAPTASTVRSHWPSKENRRCLSVSAMSLRFGRGVLPKWVSCGSESRHNVLHQVVAQLKSVSCLL